MTSGWTERVGEDDLTVRQIKNMIEAIEASLKSNTTNALEGIERETKVEFNIQLDVFRNSSMRLLQLGIFGLTLTHRDGKLADIAADPQKLPLTRIELDNVLNSFAINVVEHSLSEREGPILSKAIAKLNDDAKISCKKYLQDWINNAIKEGKRALEEPKERKTA